MPLALFRRLLSLSLGRGPVYIEPFERLVDHQATYLKNGIHAGDCRSGIASIVGAEPFYYPDAPSLTADNFHVRFCNQEPESRPSGILAPGREKRLFLFQGGGIFGSEGLVYSPRHRAAVAETACLWDDDASLNPLLRTVRFPAAIRLTGVTLNLTVRSAASYYHFLAEALPRLHLARGLLDHVDHYVSNGSPGSFHARWLAQAGVPAERIVWAGPHAHFHCDQLLFSNDLLHDQQPTPWNVSAIRASVRADPPKVRPHRRLWISRRAAHTRRIEWEQRVFGEIPGLEPVVLEELSPRQQIRLFSEAAVVVAPHGAGLANLVFCSPGAKILELFPSLPLEPLYARWAYAAGAKPSWAVVDFSEESALEHLKAPLLRFLASDA